MKINLNDIPSEGLVVNKEVPAVELGLAEEQFKCLSPIQIDAGIERADDAVLAKARVKAQYEFTCARCLKPIEQERDDRFDLYFEITPKTESINLGEDIRQEIILLFSAIALCRPDCKGLCPSCGVNLSEETCHCKKEAETTGIRITTKSKL